MIKTTEINPCPFCGCPDVFIEEVRLHPEYKQFRIECQNCGATLPPQLTLRAMLKSWNDRADVEEDS